MLVTNSQNKSADFGHLELTNFTQKKIAFLDRHGFFLASDYDSTKLEGIRLV